MLAPDPLDPNPANLQITLAPLLTERRDALDTRTAAQIKDVLLRRLEAALNDHQHQVVTLQADDLFASSPTSPSSLETLPPSATPIAATLAFHVRDSTATDTLDIRPPNAIKLKPTTHAGAILKWLSASCLNAAHQLLTIHH